MRRGGGGNDYGNNDDDDNYGDDDYGQGRGRWVACAKEGQYCDFRGRKLVRYGARGQFVQGVFRNGVHMQRRHLWRGSHPPREEDLLHQAIIWRAGEEVRVRLVVAAPGMLDMVGRDMVGDDGLEPPTSSV